MPILETLADRHRATVEAVDGSNAEAVLLSFLKAGDVDPGRPAATITAVLRIGKGDDNNLDGGTAGSWRSRVSAGKGLLHISRIDHPSIRLRTGDAVKATSRPGQPWFEVGRVDDRGDVRLVAELIEK